MREQVETSAGRFVWGFGFRPMVARARRISLWVETRGSLWGEARILAIPQFVAYLFALLLFYPGVMTVDSIDQWAQIDDRRLNDWHPPLHTLVQGLLRQVWDSPAMIAITQAVAMALASGLLLAVMRRATRAPAWAAILGAVLFAAFPLTTVATVTLWKDVFYTAAVLLLLSGATAMVCLGSTPLRRPVAFIGAVFVCVACMVFRHNGAPIAVLLATFVFYAVPTQRRVVSALIFAAFAATAFVKIPLENMLGVTRTHVSFTLAAHHIAAHLAAGEAPRRERDAVLVHSIRPGTWDYNCASVNYTVFNPAFSIDLAERHSRELASAWWRLAKAYPMTELRHLRCVSGLVWNPIESGSLYLYTVGLTLANGHVQWIGENSRGLTQASPLGSVGEYFRVCIYNFIGLTWFLRPALYLIALLAACAFALWRAPQHFVRPVLCTVIALFAQSAPLLLVNIAQDARYQLPVYALALCLIPMLVVGPLSRPRISAQ